MSAADYLQTPLQFLKGVGPKRAADLQRVGLVTVEDLLYRFPLRYEDRGRLQPIASLKPGQQAAIAGRIQSSRLRTTRRPGFKIFEALIGDATGSIVAIWMNQAFLKDILRRNVHVVLFGEVEARPGLQLMNPDYEVVDADGDAAEPEDASTIHTGRIVPVYEKAGAMTPKMQRRLMFDVLSRMPGDLPDPFPDEVRRRLTLPDRRTALMDTHFPTTDTPADRLNAFRTPAQVRLIFEEFFLFQLGLMLRKRAAVREAKPRAIQVDDRIRESARRILPFKLTEGQRRALKEIVEDMQRPAPMNRLLQGDVGAGKTIVALLAALVAMENRLQVAFMAPTEILAEQHFLSLRKLLETSRFRVELITGATTGLKRRDLLARLASGDINLLVGTHALVQGTVNFRSLGLAIIDEQHRFGVVQRATLRSKGLMPDVLVMTATPIPRTLALTVYGDLDVSVIRDMPPGRRAVHTTVKAESRRAEVYGLVRTQLDQGRQAYVVYPLIEESEKIDLKAATEMADTLAQDVFPEYRVALLHGKMKQDAKDRVMRAFAAGDIHLLVSTTVIEVGIDVPNATVMVIEHAERFGLSQLHQLRGRVGRGAHQSHCVLLYQYPISKQGKARLQALADTTNGFEIAERDLELRGPGDFFGTRQSGLPTLRTGDLLRDHSLMELARDEAAKFLDRQTLTAPLVERMKAAWPSRFGLMDIG
ncbi:MAG TPA: ATP-dependent DNA helicase RecG [Vicinamibacterales bacterium]|nr:ATP-dependent DNA helicase RecG [Vicinamibacterales bacterium]